MCRVIKPPAPIVLTPGEPSVFLAGSIEMGRAEPWQAAFEQSFADVSVTILNPRRETWDASWEQSIHNPEFRTQVEWELEGLERATVIAMYFAPETKSPITLLELGLTVKSGRLVVCSPAGYWRRGNLEVTCARYGVRLVDDITKLISVVREAIQTKLG